jgi:hypothetical protein
MLRCSFDFWHFRICEFYKQTQVNSSLQIWQAWSMSYIVSYLVRKTQKLSKKYARKSRFLVIAGGLLLCYFYLYILCVVGSMIIYFKQRQEKLSDMWFWKFIGLDDFIIIYTLMSEIKKKNLCWSHWWSSPGPLKGLWNPRASLATS